MSNRIVRILDLGTLERKKLKAALTKDIEVRLEDKFDQKLSIFRSENLYQLRDGDIILLDFINEVDKTTFDVLWEFIELMKDRQSGMEL